MFVAKVKNINWQTNPEHSPLKWKLLVDSDQTNSEGISCGILSIPTGFSLNLHHHSPQEIYCIRSGIGRLLNSEGSQEVVKDSFVYIKENEEHGLVNTGEEPLEILWIFPTNSWGEVKYNFSD